MFAVIIRCNYKFVAAPLMEFTGLLEVSEIRLERISNRKVSEYSAQATPHITHFVYLFFHTFLRTTPHTPINMHQFTCLLAYSKMYIISNPPQLEESIYN